MEHFYERIQGWFIYQSIYNLAVEQAPHNAHFVEVGSWRGRSTAYLAVNIKNSGKNIQVDCVDTWRGSVDEEVHQTDPAVVADTLYDEFIANMGPVKDIIKPVRMTSREAVKQYEDNSLDFILIDGSHEYEEVKHDIGEWLKKLKPGCYIAGDDYAWPGVEQAVKEVIPDAGIIEPIGCWLYQKPSDQQT